MDGTVIPQGRRAGVQALEVDCVVCWWHEQAGQCSLSLAKGWGYAGGMNDHVTIDELLSLPAGDRLAIIEALWDSLDPAVVPVPDWHREILAERLREDDAAVAESESWVEVRARIERR